jgi:hypothetical protein
MTQEAGAECWLLKGSAAKIVRKRKKTWVKRESFRAYPTWAIDEGIPDNAKTSS